MHPDVFVRISPARIAVGRPQNAGQRVDIDWLDDMSVKAGLCRFLLDARSAKARERIEAGVVQVRIVAQLVHEFKAVDIGHGKVDEGDIRCKVFHAAQCRDAIVGNRDCVACHLEKQAHAVGGVAIVVDDVSQ